MVVNLFTRFGVDPLEPEPKSKVGIAVTTLSEQPINGLRHPIEGDSNGWYLWCGEYAEDDDFFEPLHVEHLSDRLPPVLNYLSLPPGFRFIIDDNGYEEVWFDESLLEV